MIVTYFRSSSYNEWSWCEQSYLLKYQLGLSFGANKKAEIGNIIHKTLEVLALQKLAQQNNQNTFTCPELGEFHTHTTSPDLLLQRTFEYVKKIVPKHGWNDKDYDECKKLLENATTDSYYDPRDLKIVAAERHFELEIKEPWAYYNYHLPDEKRLTGYLRIMGCLDLVTGDENDVIEVVDYKTGRPQFDWISGKEKTYEQLLDDFQFQLYHYAATQLYKNAKTVLLTVYYIRNNTYFTLFFDNGTKVLNKIRRRFEEIKTTKYPRLIYPNWKCEKLCPYYSNNHPISDKKLCFHYKDELINVGIKKVLNNEINLDTVVNYQDGGGKRKNGRED